jgi:CheY-like chemotaxis protein
LELALMNLIINARDAMPEGGIITIAADTCEVPAGNALDLQPGSYVRLEVADEGTGIPPDLVNKVLEPFFTTKPVGKGTGLGLSMVYGFARQSGGSFRITSESGHGARAEIWLPRASEQEPVPDQMPETADLGDGPSLTILLVDDHPEVRVTTAALLREIGHSVIEAPTGAEALELLRSSDHAFDLLLSDYAMPQLSGTEIVTLAREFRPDLPALLITGYADNEVRERPEDVPILSKPFTLPDLAAAVSKTIKVHAQSSPASIKN